MKIEYKNAESKPKTFKDLKAGQTFIFKKLPYTKIRPLKTEYGTANAINHVFDCVSTVASDEVCEAVEAHLTVTSKK